MKNKVRILILENIRSVENTASIFRTASRFGVSNIILVGTSPAPLDRFGRKRRDFAKVSLGAEDEVSWEHIKPPALEKRLEDLGQAGFSILALEQTPRAQNIKDFQAPNKFALVVGNEVTGVSEELLSLADAVLEIPMPGQKRSLNVSVAAGVALFVLK